MAKDYRLSSAAKPDDLDKAFVSAKKALSLTGIPMVVTKPDEAKVSAKMTKTGKPAEFMLSCSGGKVFLTVECGGAEVVELGQMSINIAKDRKKALVVLDGLVAAKLMTQAEADKLKEGARTGPDAGELNQKIADLEKEMAATAKIMTYDDAKRDKTFFAGMVALARSERSDEGVNFLAAVEKKTKRDKIIEEFIGEKAKSQVNISDILVKPILAGGNFDDAVKEVKNMVARDTLARYRGKLTSQNRKDISALKAEIKALD